MEEAKSKGELLVIANLAEQSERYEGKQSMGGGGGGVGDVDTPCNDQYEEVPPERGTYSGVQVYERAGIS